MKMTTVKFIVGGLAAAGTASIVSSSLRVIYPGKSNLIVKAVEFIGMMALSVTVGLTVQDKTHELFDLVTAKIQK